MISNPLAAQKSKIKMNDLSDKDCWAIRFLVFALWILLFSIYNWDTFIPRYIFIYIFFLYFWNQGGSLAQGVQGWVSPPPISVLTTQTTLTDWQIIICRSPTTFPKFLGKKAKPMAEVTLYHTPINTELNFPPNSGFFSMQMPHWIITTTKPKQALISRQSEILSIPDFLKTPLIISESPVTIAIT